MTTTGGMTVPDRWDGARLVDVCWAHMGVVARRAVGPMITAGEITVDGCGGRIAQPVTAGQRLDVGEGVLARLASQRLTTPPSPLPLRVVHEDDLLLVLDKPAGMHVHPMGPHRDGTLLGGVLWHAGGRPGRPWTDYRPSPAHRLDRPTSGLVLFAKDVQVRDAVQVLLDRHEVQRTYRARVHGTVGQDDGVIDVPLGRDPDDPMRVTAVPEAEGGRAAVSRWRVLQRTADQTLLELGLETGRTHQLRAHLAHLGHPIVGDVRYGAAAVGPAPDPAVGDAIELRAVGLRLPHPSGQGTLDVSVS